MKIAASLSLLKNESNLLYGGVQLFLFKIIWASFQVVVLKYSSASNSMLNTVLPGKTLVVNQIMIFVVYFLLINTFKRYAFKIVLLCILFLLFNSETYL